MDPSDSRFTLLEATRIVARGSELDAKLDALCGYVIGAAGAVASVVYLFDPMTGILVPAAQAGLDPNILAEHGQISVDDPDELVAQSVRERRQLMANGPDAARAFTGQHLEWRGIVAVPLVAADEAGGETAEGALLAAFEGAPPDATSPENALTALADLSAVAIRQARLENALMEK